MRSQEEKWRVPEQDPAALAPKGDPERLRLAPEAADDADEAARAQLIYCGLCGALNPATSFYCAACGTTLVDAFHASEGLRVYDRPDTASRLIEIVPAGSELDIVEDPDAPASFVRVKLRHGRLGYIRLEDVSALAKVPAAAAPSAGPDINTNARGCVTQTGALAALVLVVLLTTFAFILIGRSDSSEAGIMALAACFTLGPLLILTAGLYVFARSRDEKLEMMEEEARAGARDAD